jgi:hypothetical protein
MREMRGVKVGKAWGKRERDVPGRARRSVSRPVGEGQGKQGKEARTRQAAGVGIPVFIFCEPIYSIET